MSIIPVFGEKELTKACLLLGFIVLEDRGKGGHKLAKHPIRKPKNPRQYEHITIPTAREYHSLDFRSDIIKEIMEFGFNKEQVIAGLKGKKKILKRLLK